MSNDAITIGSKTTTGGEVISGASGLKINGAMIALVGDIATCKCGSKSCKGQGKIVATSPRNASVGGVPMARVGDFVDTGCGSCYLVASQHQVSLATNTASSLNIGSGVNMGNGVNINGVSFGGGGASAATFQSSAASVTQAQTMATQATSASSLGSPAVQGASVAEMTRQFNAAQDEEDLQALAKEYRWDTEQQEKVSLALLIEEEAKEYFELLFTDTHNRLSTDKDYVGLATGLKGAYGTAKALGGLGATASAVLINGIPHIVIENYKPRYLDLGIRWQQATPGMLTLGYALNTVKGNISFLKGNTYVEIVFSGAVNAIDYMLHDEKTLSEVVGQFSVDVSRGIVTGAVAQMATLALRGILITVTGVTLPASATLAVFTIACFAIGNKISQLDKQHGYTDKMKEKVEAYLDGL